MTALASVTIALGASHAVWPIIASMVVGGVVVLAGRYLYHYEKNKRARTVADVCQAVIDRKVDPADGASLIDAVMGKEGDPEQAEGEGAADSDDASPSGPPASGGYLLAALHRILRR
jgi:hypothetical protein